MQHENHLLEKARAFGRRMIKVYLCLIGISSVIVALLNDEYPMNTGDFVVGIGTFLMFFVIDFYAGLEIKRLGVPGFFPIVQELISSYTKTSKT
jgi:hypothetical protein